jgi:hypothetical protein
VRHGRDRRDRSARAPPPRQHEGPRGARATLRVV